MISKVFFCGRRTTNDERRIKGFTLVELVLVIAILGVLAVTALPNIFNISLDTAKTNSKEATVGAIQTGIWLYGVNQMATTGTITYPAALDGEAAAAVAAKDVPLFVNVIQGGVTKGWTKTAAMCYTNTSVTPNEAYVYTAGSTGTFAYAASCP